ncbi:hypothetical protein IEQ34_001744 [Dendrobium chrysotoxum]|uniref:Alpha/beta hydrolase fold-3 domain-containing protein n=1 Tax=Dendrobium chrysotoxum TaxID=161865 RepID=A0AAV7HMH4_DENCH|nr:hypothetical protein IEQ34_001744 [Dendrobium chrysotoxum]
MEGPEEAQTWSMYSTIIRDSQTGLSPWMRTGTSLYSYSTPFRLRAIIALATKGLGQRPISFTSSSFAILIVDLKVVPNLARMIWISSAELDGQPPLKFMPPTLTVVAEHDWMRDRAIAYSEELRKVNVDAPGLEYKDTVHEFATLDMLLKTPQAQACAEDIAIWSHFKS